MFQKVNCKDALFAVLLINDALILLLALLREFPYLFRVFLCPPANKACIKDHIFIGI